MWVLYVTANHRYFNLYTAYVSYPYPYHIFNVKFQYVRVIRIVEMLILEVKNVQI